VAAISDRGNGIVLTSGTVAYSTGSSGFAEITVGHIFVKFRGSLSSASETDANAKMAYACFPCASALGYD
jgi:hypothetical protein